MEKIILIRIGEIFLKGNNKGYFIGTLKKNIMQALKGYSFTFSTSQNRFYVEEYDPDDEKIIIEKLKKIFGIYSLSVAVKLHTDIQQIAYVCSNLFPKSGKFRVSVKRADKKMASTSMEIARDIGALMLKNNPSLVVSLTDYDFEVNVDIRENGLTYIYYDKIMGQGGLPVGCGGSGMLLLSGGIDSPVAGYMMSKRGLKLFAVHFHSFPYTSEQAKEKVIDLAKIISQYCGEITLFVVPFTEIQYEIKEKCPIEYMITMMRRFMMRIAERLARDNQCGAIITGESLGQVASQTMESISVTNSVVSLPVFRPLIGFDKTDIIEISQRIGAFETSILPFEDCCTVFLPKNPVIRPQIDKAVLFEKELDVEGLIQNAIDGVEKIICSK